MLKFIVEHIQELSLAVAAFAALISVISAYIAHAANRQARSQYLDSIQPQLSIPNGCPLSITPCLQRIWRRTAGWSYKGSFKLFTAE